MCIRICWKRLRLVGSKAKHETSSGLPDSPGIQVAGPETTLHQILTIGSADAPEIIIATEHQHPGENQVLNKKYFGAGTPRKSATRFPDISMSFPECGSVAVSQDRPARGPFRQ